VSVLELSRWQFGITTVYHFLFVPLTIGMAYLVAGFETAWLRTGHERWLRLTKFYGTLFLINFAMGVVTGIVQEFQFGMNWSAYSRFVGNIFGAPLAIEALLAFFLESTFLGLWIFGWERLPRALHNACMWIVAFATTLSAYFILVANSWMQHPVGSSYNPRRHIDELSSFRAVLFNPAQLAAFPHVMAAALLTAGALVAGVAMWHLMRPGAGQKADEAARPEDAAAFRSAVKAGAITVLAAAVVTIGTGDLQGKLFTTRFQPMKMAAAEALYHTSAPAPLSLLTIGTWNGAKQIFTIGIPRVLSFLATGNWSSPVQGIDNLQAHYSQVYGPGSYIPYVPVIYWSFRLMIGAGMLAALIALIALIAIRGGRAPRARWLAWSVMVVPLLPLAANTFGWIMTEMGRQPWVVYGQLRTSAGVSANPAGEVLASMIVLTVLYGVLAVIEAGLLLKFIRAGLAPEPAAGEAGGQAETAGLVY
jgi:cytochrome d ubiquinol oxidase subunit I